MYGLSFLRCRSWDKDSGASNLIGGMEGKEAIKDTLSKNNHLGLLELNPAGEPWVWGMA